VSTRQRNNVVVFVIAALFSVGSLVAGSVLTYKGLDGRNQVAAQLAQEHITVSPDTPDKAYAGKPVVDGPSAQAQADVIWVHMMEASNGKTYAQLPNKGPTATPAVLQTRATLQTGDALRSALLSSALAWNVASLVILLGVTALGFGLAFLVVAGVVRPRRVQNTA
jgi:hypothetical protein